MTPKQTFTIAIYEEDLGKIAAFGTKHHLDTYADVIHRMTQQNQDWQRLNKQIIDQVNRANDAEDYAREMSEWLDLALDALGAKTVFDIPGWYESHNS